MATKLLFYTHGLVDGGAERLWSCLASSMKSRGYDVIFVQDFAADENKANLDPSIPLFTLGPGHFQAVRKLAELLKSERPDVSLSAVGGCNTKILAAKALARSPVKTIITYHGAKEWRTGLASLATFLGLPFLSAAADRTIAVSGGLRELLIRAWGANPHKTVTILNPVFFPADAPVPTKEELAARPKNVLAVGRLVPEKGFITLVRAFARVSDHDAKLVILGKGPEEGRIRDEIARLGLKDRVTLPGYSKEPWTHYAQSRCFVLSSASEPFGNVVVEAMAYGLPIVATACAGPQEILRFGEYGAIVAVDNEFQLANAIAAALKDPGDPAPRRRRADDFAFDRRVPAYEALVREILGEAGEANKFQVVTMRERPKAAS